MDIGKSVHRTLWEAISTSIWRGSVHSSVYNSVYGLVKDSIWELVYGPIRDSVNGSVYNPVDNSILT